MMTHAVPELAEAIERRQAELVAFRHDLHRHPELAFEERRTSTKVAAALEGLGIQVKTGLAGGTGVIGYLPPTKPTGLKAVALRADMDALPIVEQTGRAYASAVPGVMHACGHDGHTTILLGAAAVLSKMERPRGVLFVFQPAEEGGGGGDKMCREGVLEGSKGRGLGDPVGEIYGLHGWPTLTVGTVATRVGPLLASVDDFKVTVRGTQAHGAYPHQGHDAILAASHMITMLQSIASRNVGPLDSVVVSVGAINAGTADNIIPETCTFIGTVRTLTPEIKKLARERFYAIIENAAKAMHVDAKIHWDDSYPVTVNDAGATAKFFETARGVLPEEKVITLNVPTMGGEDFSYYGRHVPSCFFFLGLKPVGAARYPALHQPDFDFNDAAIPLGVELMCRLALT